MSAADGTARVTATGVFDALTGAALGAWQAKVGLPVTGVVAPSTWRKLWQGAR